MAGRIATEMAVEYRYYYRMLGIPINGPVRLLGDNKGMIQTCARMSAQLKKKHHAISYHIVREQAAIGTILPGHIRTQHNLADINTKQLNGPQTHSKNQQLIFRSVDSGEGLNPITKETGESMSDQTVKTTVRSLTQSLTSVTLSQEIIVISNK